ncbi:4-(cytidine 5'-diphospho)-2-C-methyl-D-erythritol kinase [Leptolyngbya cf. ectocarpi LEGE 11479]|uniref:4-diphosphocytidyl-2-C-methyl-D-erythritol kinase n=1 Tax=Leptolyngbya cf. ectocarpi LEGE 11479 TaxID=1828722 RepID=A0A928ZTR8_LEPEC|nr:4-(cytidine 5'-diphospho)-2-C-methyl-D-erythritol kinase [Leptolyngbya ectocarpi]MBE9066899.1 4-(cytidine 5'-diphospho)-2-C-methyl-D-erythritol kinase [Leptolyngbya cf. ectocarpi LEGE 11479]
MTSYTLLSAAKINLYLEIIGHRPDGFHEMAMVMQSVDLCDRITLTNLTMAVRRLQCDHPQVPTDSSNLALKAVQLLTDKFPELANRGVEITIEKYIPVGAGLAGGSGNAAATLVGLNLLWKLGLTQIELEELAAQLGSDIPFCIRGGTAIATGRGEILDPIPSLTDLYVVLAKYESLSISTPWAYKTYRANFSDHYADISDSDTLQERQQRVHASPMVTAISHQDGAAIGSQLYNDLERVVLPAHNKVQQLRDRMANHGGLGTMMSGSGPTVFTLVKTQEAADAILGKVRTDLPDPDLKLWTARCTATGIRLESDT